MTVHISWGAVLIGWILWDVLKWIYQLGVQESNWKCPYPGCKKKFPKDKSASTTMAFLTTHMRIHPEK